MMISALTLVLMQSIEKEMHCSTNIEK